MSVPGDSTPAAVAGRCAGRAASLPNGSPSTLVEEDGDWSGFGRSSEAIAAGRGRARRHPRLRDRARQRGQRRAWRRRAGAPPQPHLSRQGRADQRAVVSRSRARPERRRTTAPTWAMSCWRPRRSRREAARARHRARASSPASRRAWPAASAGLRSRDRRRGGGDGAPGGRDPGDASASPIPMPPPAMPDRSLPRAASLPCHERQTQHERQIRMAPRRPRSQPPSSRTVGSPRCAPGSACPARRPCGRCSRTRSRAPATAAPSPPKSARCCCASCASARCASTTSWCRAPTSSPSTRTSRSGELLKTFDAAGVSRMPLFRETLDDPRGMIHVKDCCAG